MKFQYGIFDTDLYRKEYPDKIDSWLTELKSEQIDNFEIVDNYANHYDYGLYSHDDRNAIIHALFMLIQLQKQDVSAEQKKFCLSLLRNDIENYFLCVKYGNGENVIFMKTLFRNLIGYNQDEWLIRIVQGYYNDVYYVEDEPLEEIVNRSLKFDFYDLYMQAGDKALYESEDIELAMCYYRLADLDWYGLYAEELITEIDFDESIRNKKTELHEEIALYKQIAEGTANGIDLSKMHITGIGSLYVEILLMEEKGVSSEELVCKSNGFWLEFSENVKTCIEQHALRQLYLMAHVVRKKTILAAASCLYGDEDKQGKAYYNEQVLNVLKKMKEGKLGKLALYISQYPTEIGLVHNALLLCKAAEVTEQILRELRVKEIQQNLAYYTSMDTFFKMLPSGVKDTELCGRLSIMNISYMNDPNEGKILRNCVCEGWSQDENSKSRKSVRIPYVFMKCFTSQVDYLPMWEMYGEHAKGCCLVLDREQPAAQTQIPLYKVCYVERTGHDFYIKQQDNRNITDTKMIQCNLRMLAKIFKEMQEDDWRKMFCDILGMLVYLFKDNSYYYEQECRILYEFSECQNIIRHTNGEYPLLFIQTNFPVQLKEIILGPKFENLSRKIPYIQEQVEEMCRRTGIRMPEITISDIDYR